MPDAPNAKEILKVISAIVFGLVSSFFAHLVVFSIFPHESVLLFLIIPISVLSFGYYLMRKNNDFEYLEITVKYTKSYFKILLALSVLFATFLMFLLYSREAALDWQILEMLPFHLGLDSQSWEDPVFTVISFVASYATILVIQRLYFAPLSNHKEWVAERGIFSKDQRRRNKSSLVAPDQAKNEGKD